QRRGKPLPSGGGKSAARCAERDGPDEVKDLVETETGKSFGPLVEFAHTDFKELSFKPAS
ncbi:hypothetical protein, partial [Roseibium sp. RKSG952]|uniref:hypothetical protein n=1 Tax=Roseibium sp. RKSG952 TaxID=2529384 RepID=UPI001AD8F645